MKISDSSLQLSSCGAAIAADRQSGILALSTSSPGQSEFGNATPVDVSISSEAQKAYYSSQEAEISSRSVVTSGDDSANKQVIVTEEDQVTTSQGSSGTSATTTSARSSVWNITFSSTDARYEAEQRQVSVNGVVTTQDGREISFTLNLGLSREYAYVDQEKISVNAVVDPLVINYQGGLPGLSGAKFSFDINSDGIEEQVSETTTGSGFLALDRNGDGRINNGSELFGPSTGSGFSELSGYDSDQNGWIDENDPIFSRLSVWTKDEAGNDKLLSLKNAGIGALSVNAVASPFSLTGEENQLKGQVQNTGVYLSEQGKVGVMQQIDLAVEVSGKSANGQELGSVQQSAESSRTDTVKVMEKIARLVATAALLASKSSEIGRALRRELSENRKSKHGDADPIVKYLDDAVKAYYQNTKEHRRSAFV